MEEAPEQWLKTTTSDRFLGCSQTDDDAYAVYIDQIDLKGTARERLERELHALWRTEFPQLDLEIYFRPRATPIKQRGPQPNALGVEVKRRAIPGVHKIVAVASGKGGVGKSTVAANLAVGLAQAGLRVGLLDADLYGPSAPMMLGNASRLQVSDAQKLIPVQAHGVKMVSFGNLADASTPIIWRGPLATKAFEQLCYDVTWGDLDYLVLDLPPGTGDIQLTMIERLPVAGALIVSTPQDIALIDVAKGVSMFQKLDVPILGLVENMSAYVCSNCGHEEHIFGSQLDGYADSQNIEIIARVPLQVELRQRSDAGNPFGSQHPSFDAIVKSLLERSS